MRIHFLLALTVLGAGLCGCSYVPAAAPAFQPPAATFADYWYKYGAEISRYDLQQARYGSVHQGDAVLIYVTENFDPVRQVKYEGAEPVKAGTVPVLKLNFTKKFTTGVYPYSMMSSIFASAAHGPDWGVLKVATSSQEWCGHTFTQLNRGKDDLRLRQYSYFQKEGDIDARLAPALTEAGIWMLIRIDPDKLPLGELKMIPSTMDARLSHWPLQVETVAARFEPTPDRGLNGEELRRYVLEYPERQRTLAILFQAKFPYLIEGWEESRLGKGDKVQRTSARRTHTTMLDYWRRRQPADRQLRVELGLEP